MEPLSIMPVQDDLTAEEELRLAAEAVVDAAIICQQNWAVQPVSEETRRSLIDAVYRDPLITGKLLHSSFWLS